MATRQYEQQERLKAEGRCRVCGKPLFNANFCLKHAIIYRERQRKYLGNIRRNKNCASYKGERT